MPKEKTQPTEKKPRVPRQQSPEIAHAKAQTEVIRAEAEIKCKELMAQARQAVKVRKLTEAMTPEQKQALLATLKTEN